METKRIAFKQHLNEKQANGNYYVTGTICFVKNKVYQNSGVVHEY